MKIAVAALLVATCPYLLAQQGAAHDADLQQLTEQLREVVATLQATRTELQHAEQRIDSLQDEVKTLRASAPAEAPTPEVADELSVLQQQQQLLSTRVDQQYQTKVESGSKYRVRLSGMVLFNASTTRGTVSDQDVPMLAEPTPAGTPGGNISATMRQTLMNVDVFGPDVAGAHTSANVQFDFFGGSPATLDGVAMGIARMRVARARFDWSNWSLTIGQDQPFISPNSPTTLAAIGTPEFGYSGNLWTWTPQIVAERRWELSDTAVNSLQFGLLDPFTGEFPSDYFSRYPEPGELSRMPAFAARESLTFGSGVHKSSVGVSAYTARHDFGFGRTVTGWAGTADWDIGLGQRFAASGEFYRGRALGGLWGGIGTSVVFHGDPNLSQSPVFAVNSIGGWAQLKYRATPKLEFNGAFGEDSPFARDLRQFMEPYSYTPYLRNWTTMFNVIEHLRSNLMLSLEYKHLNTVDFTGKPSSAENVNMGVGVSF